MSPRWSVLITGAVGLVLAALFYLLAAEMNGALRVLIMIPDASIVIFLILLAISLLEIALMMYALASLAARVPVLFLCVIAGGYVAFAGVYTLMYGLFVPDARGMQALAGLALVRWLTLWFLPFRKETM
ncbi:MAG: hypothetical protein IT331_10260 [Anaerolineae bacterium]|nr:hypothetical protein [Anaerolineae bacterium]